MQFLIPFIRSKICSALYFYTLLLSTISIAEASQTLSIYGSNTIGSSLAPALAEGLLKQKGFTHLESQSLQQSNQQIITAGLTALKNDARIHIHSQGSSTGFVALHEKRGDIAASSRPIKENEARLLSPRGDMHSISAEHVIAIDGLAIIVHPDNPINDLSITQLADIFSGQITDWSMLGAHSGPIRIYARDHNSGSWETFKELVLTPSDKVLSSQAKRFESSEQLADLVSKDIKAIGFIGLPYVRQAKALAVSTGEAQAMYPTAELIATEDYPLSRRLYLYSTEHQNNPLAQEFLLFAQSDAGQRLVESNGFISQTVSAMSVVADDSMPVQYQQLAQQAQRLSVNFRFKQGSAELDNKALHDIDRVLAYLRKHNKMKNKLVLVGFGDSKSDPERARLLSKLRAMAVRRQLHNNEIIFRDIIGIGDAMPVASNNLDQGRVKNRRVELWVYSL